MKSLKLLAALASATLLVACNQNGPNRLPRRLKTPLPRLPPRPNPLRRRPLPIRMPLRPRRRPIRPLLRRLRLLLRRPDRL